MVKFQESEGTLFCKTFIAVLVGDGMVGKDCFVHRGIYGRYLGSTPPNPYHSYECSTVVHTKNERLKKELM